MAVEYTNRIGKTYYLIKGLTKKGNPKYFFSLNQQKGELVQSIPDGYEIYEHPGNSQVFLRKELPQKITELEKKIITNHMKNLERSRCYKVDYKNDFITIYESNVDIEHFEVSFSSLLKKQPETMKALMREADKDYTPVLRFCLVDEKRRFFETERFCFRGSIDDWISISAPDHLEKVAKKYLKLLGTEDFYNTHY